ncbi:uncharacterized protein TEOVI_000310600 [Trypanosoma equiperdum]|uniref:T. brucei spp.-specific protein n=2 Tax=Trypanozoon TaxID=39700 RepID=Q57ZR9_TRYB2|nr:hypothetical protein Tb927.5.2000 [Trypanosoma brucei brucei TREU927]AAX79097.1 hypothetical protein Tb927.5.2000 [Trypanosoma brucei]AAZ11315.1 hypothetical protein Tb927.5.2000 [Trypanosoma brucei brucei TREU927]SCU71525.1 hypothetical protein, conserved [Trypanosoma equiperdum]
MRPTGVRCLASPLSLMRVTGTPNTGPRVLSPDGTKFSWDPYSGASVDGSEVFTQSPHLAAQFPGHASPIQLPPPNVASDGVSFASTLNWQSQGDGGAAYDSSVVGYWEETGPNRGALRLGSDEQQQQQQQQHQLYRTGPLAQTFFQTTGSGAPPFDNAVVTHGDANFNSGFGVVASPHRPSSRAGRYGTSRGVSLSASRGRSFESTPLWGHGQSGAAERKLPFRRMIPPPVPYELALRQLSRSGLADPERVLEGILRHWHRSTQVAVGVLRSEAASSVEESCPSPPSGNDREAIVEWVTRCEGWWQQNFGTQPRSGADRQNAAHTFNGNRGHRSNDGRRPHTSGAASRNNHAFAGMNGRRG